jgi:hypothetical protein
MPTVKDKSRGTLGVVASVVLHVLFFGGCLLLDTSNISADGQKGQDVTEINQIPHTTAMAKEKS